MHLVDAVEMRSSTSALNSESWEVILGGKFALSLYKISYKTVAVARISQSELQFIYVS